MIKDYQNKIFCGDALTILKSLPDEIIDVGVTSPPYNKGENKKGWLVANVKYIGKHIVTKTFKERKERGEFTGKYRNINQISDDKGIDRMKLF